MGRQVITHLILKALVHIHIFLLYVTLKYFLQHCRGNHRNIGREIPRFFSVTNYIFSVLDINPYPANLSRFSTTRSCFSLPRSTTSSG